MRKLVYLLAAAAALALPASGSAEIVYTHGQTSPPRSGTWVPSTLWAMNDNGSDPHQIVSPAQALSSQQAVCCASLQPNSSTAVFDGFDYQYAGNAAGGQGDYYEGMYVLSGGTVTRLSPQPVASPGQSRYDAPAVLTANGQVIFQRQTAEYEPGNPGQQGGATWSMDEEPVGGGALSPWLWVGDNGQNSLPGFNASLPPTTFASDPADPSLVAYSLGKLYIDNRSNTDAVDVAAQPSAYANGGLAWNPDGTELVDVDNTPTGDVGTPGADGYSPGLWMFSASANGAHHLVLASPGAGDSFSSPVFVGQNEIAFVAENNIWEVPASCNACSFPSGAKQLTTNGTSATPDDSPSWTSKTITGPTPPPPPVKFKVTVSASSTQKVIKQHGIVATFDCKLACSIGIVASVQIKGSKKTLHSYAAGTLAANRPDKVSLTLSKSALKAITKALAKHKKVAVRIYAAAKDAAGTIAQASKTFTVKH